MSDAALGSRIKKARQYAGISVNSLAREIGRTAFTVYRYEWGRLTPPGRILDAIAARCGVSREWLGSGLGKMKSRSAA